MKFQVIRITEKHTIGILGSLLFFAVFVVTPAYAVTTIDWDLDSYFITSGSVTGLSGISPIFFTVTDTDLAGNSQVDTINVQITSNVDSQGIILTLTEDVSDNGEFQNENLVLMENNAEFKITDTALIILEDPDANTDPTVIETLVGSVNGVQILSESDPPAIGGIFIDLVETGPDTGEFSGTFSFSTSGSDSSTNTILVSEGDVIAVVDVETNSRANGLITPSPPANIGAILAEVDGTVTASYNAISASIDVASSGSGGRGTNTPDRPSLGASGESSLIGKGCRGDCTPPTLGVFPEGKRIVDNGFSYNGNPVNVESFYTPYPLITVNVGEENVTILKIYENGGPQNIKHVELAFGLGKGERIGDSKAKIELDIKFDGTETVTVFDPEKALQDVRVESEVGGCGTSVVDAKCLIVTIYHTFRESLDFDMVGTYVWDFRRNGWQNYYNHGIHIMGESLNPPDEYDGYHKGHKYHLTETGKGTATDENDNTWSLVKGLWEMDYIPNKKIDDGITMHGFNRDNARFDVYKQGQILLAENTLNSQVLLEKSILNEQFYDSLAYYTIEYPDRISRSQDSILQENMMLERIKAEKIFEKTFGHTNTRE